MSDLKYEIKRKIGVLGETSNGWKKELNVVSWNDRNPKLDIREWDENHEKMSKGVTFNQEETIELKKLLEDMDPAELTA